ncbi:MAG: tail fiber domain-containing protein [Chitinophagaceae bacterium]|nr:tail fiber domain-containing protein [Chitinophagaceae bacterium]
MGDFSTSTGRSNYATGYSTLVAGMYNDSIITRQTAVTSSTPLLIIGNGNSEIDRTNALVVLKNGNVAIGDNGNPVNKLHITGTINNVSLSDNSGMMTIGYTSSTNMVIDQNDLQVRNSGAISDLYLQRLGGNVGIGNTGVPAYQLELSTNSAGKPGTNTWTIASDLRLKQNINPYTQGLQQLMQINPVTYHYNEKSGFDTKPEYVGIIAQDLQKIAPYMVSTVKRNDADYLGVDNGAMTYMLINAVKEQQEIIEALKKRIEVLERK